MFLKDELDIIVRYKAGLTDMARFNTKLIEYFTSRKNALDNADLPEYQDRLKELKAAQAAVRNIMKSVAAERGEIWKYGVSFMKPGDKVSDLFGLESDFGEVQVDSFNDEGDIVKKLNKLTIEKKSEYKVDYKALVKQPLPATYTVVGWVIDGWGKSSRYFAELKRLDNGETYRVRASHSLHEILEEKTKYTKNAAQFDIIVSGKFYNKKCNGNIDLRVKMG